MQLFSWPKSPFWYNAAVVEPRIVPREGHPISRRDIDADALKVLYRLREANHVAYLVAGIVRSIGDPDVRLREDPVRMIRAIALAARLDFTIEPTLLAAIRRHRHEI